ncbi:hypothetical protein [Actinopolyspora mortivallis]|uniref:hypothetical protein n=1 Tax=Actinopolyspora mortivallis TaxID=33906 RepID=UPI00036E597E|nr:hypothetical protein [Actinopolyspora mortivallis]
MNRNESSGVLSKTGFGTVLALAVLDLLGVGVLWRSRRFGTAPAGIAVVGPVAILIGTTARMLLKWVPNTSSTNE